MGKSCLNIRESLILPIQGDSEVLLLQLVRGGLESFPVEQFFLLDFEFFLRDFTTVPLIRQLL